MVGPTVGAFEVGADDGVVVGEADTYGEVVGDTVGAGVLAKAARTAQPGDSVGMAKAPKLTRFSQSLLGSVSGIVSSPVYGHMADGDDEGELVVGVAVGAPVIGVMLGLLEVGGTLNELDEGADDGVLDDGASDGVLVVG